MRSFNYTKPSPFCQYTNLAPFLDNSSTSKPKPPSLSFSFCRHPKRSLVIQSVAWNLLERSFVPVVISTKHSAWRNPLRRSSTTPCKIPNLTVIQSVAWNLLERLPLKTKQYKKRDGTPSLLSFYKTYSSLYPQTTGRLLQFQDDSQPLGFDSASQ